MQHFETIIDEKGNRKAVVVPISAWEEILDALEELDDIRAYDEAIRDPSEIISFDQAVSQINRGGSD